MKKLFPYLVFFLASSFCIYEFMMRVMPSAMTHELMHSFGIQAQGLGFLASLFYYGYTPMQIPAGLLYDRIGPRKLLALTTLLCAISGLIFGNAHSVYIASIGRFLTGFTASFAFIGALLVAARWFAPQRFAMFAGVVQMLGCLGAIIGEAPIAAMVSGIGWRHTTEILSVIGIVTSFAIWLVIRDYPKNAKHLAPKNEIPPHTNTLTGLKRICRNPQTWTTAAAAFCCWAPITIFATLWGPAFLERTYDISTTAATGLTSVVWIAIAIGSPLAGWWSNKIASRRIPLICFFVLGLLASLMVIYGGRLNHSLNILMLFMFGFAASAQSITFGLVLDNNHDRIMGTAVGFNNMAVIAGGIILQPLVGVVLKHLWQHNPIMHNGVPFYSMHDYRLALMSIPLCFGVGLLFSLLAIKETHCQRLAIKPIALQRQR